MRELMLIENPSRRRGRNPVYVAPFSYTRGHKRVRVPGYVKHLPGERNPGGRTMARRNQIARVIPREWTQGVDLMDAGAALGGLAASTMLPGMIVRTADTMGQKIWKLVVCLGATVGAGMVLRNVSPGAGKMAVAGGLAGTLSQALSMFTNVKIGQPGRSIRTSTVVSPSYSREQETVQLITP